jgi:hypothetical protein
MKRPDLEWFIRRLAGEHGHALRRHMEHVHVPVLLDYIQHLEKLIDENQKMQ